MIIERNGGSCLPAAKKKECRRQRGKEVRGFKGSIQESQLQEDI